MRPMRLPQQGPALAGILALVLPSSARSCTVGIRWNRDLAGDLGLKNGGLLSPPALRVRG